MAAKELVLVWAALAVAALAAGCGANCQQIQADKSAFYQASSATSQPHVVFLLPRSTLNDLVDSQIQSLGTASVPKAGLGVIDNYISSVKLQLLDAAIVPTSEGRLGLDIGMGLKYGNKTVGKLGTVVALTPEIDGENGRIRLGLRPKDLLSVKPQLLGGAEKALESAIKSAIPGVAKSLVPSKTIAKAASSLLERVINEGWGLVRNNLLGKVDNLASVSIDIPKLPIKDAEWFVQGKHVRIEVLTTLAVAEGVSAKLPFAVGSKQAAVQASGAAIAAIGNYGMKKGWIPSRYDRSGKPTPNGTITAGLRWTSDSKPVRVHAWQEEQLCMSAVIAGNPALSVAANGDLDVAITGGEIAEFSGPPLMELGVWLQGLWADAFELAESVSLTGKTDFAGKELSYTLQKSVRKGDQIGLLFNVGSASP